MPKYDRTSLDELLSRQHDNAAERAKLLEEARELQTAIDRKAASDAAKERVASMSDAEREALAQALQANGIASEEAVGNLGG